MVGIEREGGDFAESLAAACYKLLAESSSDGLLVQALDGSLLYVNPACREQWGITEQLLESHGPWCWVGERALIPAKIDQLFRQGQTRFESSWIPGSGTVAYQEAFACLADIGDERVVLVALHDISKRVENEQRIEHLAYHDDLTGLPNRAALNKALEKTLAAADRYGDQVGLIFLDLNGFKPINDSYGHIIGDRVLQEIASRLGSCFRETDTIARYGGDEFVAVIPRFATSAALMAIAGKLQDVISRPVKMPPDDEITIRASIGYAIREPGESAESLISRADTHMYGMRKKLTPRL